MPDQTDFRDLDLSQYFGTWAMEQTRFQQIFGHLRTVDLSAHIAANNGRDIASPPIERVSQDGFNPESETTSPAVIAVLSIDGTMTKRGSSFGAAASVLLRKEIRNAANDPAIDAILLVIDSPGGTVAGTADLAAEVKAAAGKKPLFAQVEDCCCSAAYWVASQANKVFANDRTAIVGSIGTYMGIYDESERYTLEGIKPVLIATGEHKGAGFPGTEVTETQRAHFQSIIDQTQRSFSDAVSSGRQLSAEEVATLADGKVWLADTATELRLIDGIQSTDATLEQLASEVSQTRGSQQMAASYQELKAECVGADPAFICSQLDRQVEIGDARKNWMAEQNRRLQAAKKRAEEDEEDPAAEEEEEEPKGKGKRAKRRGKRSEEEEEEPQGKGKHSRRRGKRAEEEEEDPAAEEDEDDPEAEGEEDDPEEDEEETQSRRRGRRQSRRHGVKPLTYGRGSRASIDYSDPIAAFNTAVARNVKAGMDRKKAVHSVVREDPELHEAYKEAYNRAHRS